MNKNFIYGAGALGLIGIAVYIYREHKKAKEAEQESIICIDDETPDSEENHEQEKETKKNAISEKIANISHKIGKTVGTVILKIGAKYPKAVQFICKYSKFWPVAVIAGCAIVASIIKKPRWQIDESQWTTKDIENDHDIDIFMTSQDPDKSMKAWESTDLSKNFYQLSDLLKTMNFVYGEQYFIQEKQSFEDMHPDYDCGKVDENYVIRQIFDTDKALESVA